MEDQERTIFCGNLSMKVTEELLYELFLQAAPLEKVKIPTDKDGRPVCYAFVTFKHKISVPYAVDLMQGITLYQKKLILKPRSTAGHVLQENDKQRTPILQKSIDLNSMILSGQMQVNSMNSKRVDISPVSRRERGFNHGYDRRNDKPYGQVFRNRNNRYDFDSRMNHANSHYRRH